ncbi:MAG: hypothetical protein GY751_18125 [Bacteroidetes bacterium]|nr:hypothetical protein [Bacteroidota bacterium]
MGNLIKFVDNELYKKYLLEGFNKGDDRFVTKGSRRKKKNFPKKDKSVNSDYFETVLGAQRVDRIPLNHNVYLFLNKRRIPKSAYERLYFIHDDKNLEKVDKKYHGRIRGNQSRLILPFFDRKGKPIGLAARAINPAANIRYLAFRLDETVPMIFGLEHLKRNSREPILVVEGPIDSLFLPNCIAVAGADFAKLEDAVRTDKCILVFDNEPRNKEIVKRMGKMIDAGYKICIWPETIKEKDINDMILAGKTQDQIVKTINTNTHSGLAASATLNKWKRCKV